MSSIDSTGVRWDIEMFKNPLDRRKITQPYVRAWALAKCNGHCNTSNATGPKAPTNAMADELTNNRQL